MHIRSQSGQVPTWLKVVLALVVVGFAALVGVIFLAGSLVADFGKQSLDPHQAEKIGDEIIQLRRPLPSGWQYSMGVNMGVMKMAMLMNSADHTVMNLTRYPKSKNTSAITEGAANGAHMAIEERGEEKLAGHDMSFVRGKSKGGGNGTVLAMELCSITADNGDLILIHSVEPGKSKFDRAIVTPILERVITIH